MVNVLDLFAGLGGWSQAFKDRGHSVFTVDIDPAFDVDLHADILALRPEHIPFNPDIILASPPCETFSVMRMGRNWTHWNEPRNKKARYALEMVEACMNLIHEMSPVYWLVENPRGKLRKMDVMAEYEIRTVTYCKLGMPYMKPTDLWGGFPPSLELPPMCKNGDPCHLRAPRGSKSTMQGWGWHNENSATFKGSFLEEPSKYASTSVKRKELVALRSKIPYKLSELVCLAVEKDLLI